MKFWNWGPTTIWHSTGSVCFSIIKATFFPKISHGLLFIKTKTLKLYKSLTLLFKYKKYCMFIAWNHVRYIVGDREEALQHWHGLLQVSNLYHHLFCFYDSLRSKGYHGNLDDVGWKIFKSLGRIYFSKEMSQIYLKIRRNVSTEGFFL